VNELKKKWICYYKPHRWHTLDEWEMQVEEVPEEQVQMSISYGTSKFIIGQSLNSEGLPMTTLLRLDSMKAKMTGSVMPATGALEAEVWEPAGGWRTAISWSMGNNGKPKVD
jgi:hypothetical protein